MWPFKSKNKEIFKSVSKNLTNFPVDQGFIAAQSTTDERWRLKYNEIFSIDISRSSSRHDWYHVSMSFKLNVDPESYIVDDKRISDKLVRFGFDMGNSSKLHNELYIRCGIIDTTANQATAVFKLVNEIDSVYQTIFDSIKMPDNKVLMDSTHLSDYFLAMEEEFDLGVSISDNIFYKVVNITRVKNKFKILDSIGKVHNIIEDDIVNMEVETNGSTIKVSIFPKLKSIPIV